jgi:hypothetical protein
MMADASLSPAVDLDEDGYSSCEDCDDTDEYTFPGAAELESFNDCMTDVDDDGWAASNPSEGVVAGSDCDDDASGRIGNISASFKFHPLSTSPIL